MFLKVQKCALLNLKPAFLQLSVFKQDISNLSRMFMYVQLVGS